MEKIAENDLVFPNIKYKKTVSLEAAKLQGDFAALSQILRNGSEWIINEIKDSGLRGRGGAGFSTGMKMSFMPKAENSQKPHYLVINADESEPGTCKDREILTWEPYKLIQGAIFACKAISAKTCYIYVRGEYFKEIQILQDAIDNCYKDGILGKSAIDIFVHRGAGAYICGEESALLESLEGKRGVPRLKPPFPANFGLYGCPTTINNVETIASIGAILTKGANWYKSFGRANNHGTKLYSISGNVKNPCIFEERMSVKLRDIIEEYAGGVIDGWDNLLAIVPGGSSCPLITKELAENAIMDYDGMKECGSSFGTAGIIVINKENCIIDIICRFAYFYKHESCGQCTPCREGTKWIYDSLQKIKNGTATRDEVEKLFDLTKSMEGNTICALADAASWPVQGLIKHFKDEMLTRCV